MHEGVEALAETIPATTQTVMWAQCWAAMPPILPAVSEWSPPLGASGRGGSMTQTRDSTDLPTGEEVAGDDVVKAPHSHCASRCPLAVPLVPRAPVWPTLQRAAERCRDDVVHPFTPTQQLARAAPLWPHTHRYIPLRQAAPTIRGPLKSPTASYRARCAPAGSQSVRH